MEAYQIIHQVQEVFRGIAVKLSRLTGKSDSWFSSHGREPKSSNPLQNGNPSPVTHYMQYARLYEASLTGAGQMLNERVFAELEMEFTAKESECTQKELHAGVLKESFDVLKCLGESDLDVLSSSELAQIEREGAELRDKASEVVSHVRALRRMRMMGATEKSGFVGLRRVG